ncbi:MAG: ribosome biogenesis GTPase Der [Planctomycetota bacterium]|nr:ribosome biogenesis GTPase Der [Planctomycetota bacterium]MDA1105358.1 ribosome biogenesis GTPase Der [Planctomycetota bacterium]
MLPLVAIIGRPNVGKSSLFNRLVGRRVSIVDPTPGVTRDRITEPVELHPPPERRVDDRHRSKWVELCDTAGFGVYTAEGGRFDDAGMDLAKLTPHVEEQIRHAAAIAAQILFVVDVQQGITGPDREVATMLRSAGHAAKVVVVANKCDSESWELQAAEANRFGFGEPSCVSAMNGAGLRLLGELLWERLHAGGAGAPGEGEHPADTEIKIAIVGRRNAGKSSLVNALAGQERVIVSEIAGTTRDSVDVRFEIGGRTFVAIDTAGVRKQRSLADDVEYYASRRTEDSIRRADVCLLMLDATEKASHVEKKLSSLIVECYKPVILVINKWDLVEKKLKVADYEEYLSKEFPHLGFAPIVTISAKAGQGLDDVVGMAFNLVSQASHREGTGQLNAAIRRILLERGPSSALGTRAKVFYVSQIDTRPPTIACVVNKPELFKATYQRYLLNRLREEVAYSEVPIKLLFSARKQRALTGGGVHEGAVEAGEVETSDADGE